MTAGFGAGFYTEEESQVYVVDAELLFSMDKCIIINTLSLSASQSSLSFFTDFYSN